MSKKRERVQVHWTVSSDIAGRLRAMSKAAGVKPGELLGLILRGYVANPFKSPVTRQRKPSRELAASLEPGEIEDRSWSILDESLYDDQDAGIEVEWRDGRP